MNAINPFDPFGQRVQKDAPQGDAADAGFKAWEENERNADAQLIEDLQNALAQAGQADGVVSAPAPAPFAASAPGVPAPAAPAAVAPVPGASAAAASAPASAAPAAPVAAASVAAAQQPAPSSAPPVQQPAPAAPAEPEHHQVHHSYIWLGSLRVFGIVVAAVVISQIASIASVIGSLSEGVGDDLLGALIAVGVTVAGLVVLAVAIVVYQLVSYKHLYFTLGSREFTLYQGVLNKKRTHVPYQRVQSVDQNASLLQRIFGVCTVSIDTAGGSSNKAVQVPYITRQEAEWLRRELFGRKRLLAQGVEDTSAAMAQLTASFAAASAGTPAATAAPAPGAPAYAGAPAPAAPQAASASTLGTSAPAAPQPASASAPGASAAFSAPAAPATASPVPAGNILDVGDDLWREFGGVFAGADLDTGTVSYEYGLTNKELVLAGLSNNTAFVLVILGIIGVFTQVGDVVFGLFPGTEDQVIGGIAAQAAHPFDGGFIIWFILAFVVAAAVLWVLSGISSCINYGGFAARRRESRIEVEHGLLKHTFQGIDIDRVQSVIIKQGFVRRCIGYCEISLGKIDAASSDGDEQQAQSLKQGVVIHPFVKLDRVPEILAGIIPEYSDVPREARPLPPCALRRGLIRRCLWQGDGFWLAVFVALVQIGFNLMGPFSIMHVFDISLGQADQVLGIVNTGALVLYAVAVALLVLNVVGTVLWYRESSFAFNRRFMQITSGGFSRETTSFPRQKIQYAFTSTNPFQRAAHVTTISARTAAGVGGHTVKLRDVREEDADAWLAWVKPRGNMLQ